MSSSKSKLALDWEAIARFAATTSMKIRLDEFRPDLIIGVFRGGVIPAALVQRSLASFGPEALSDYKTATVFAASYSSDHSQGDLKVEIPKTVRDAVACAHNILLVDDIYDTGVTLRKIKEYIDPRVAHIVIRTAVLITKKPSGTDYFGQIVDPSMWVEFPWEDNREDG